MKVDSPLFVKPRSKRSTERTTSWLLNTHDGGAPTSTSADIELSIFALISSAFHKVVNISKLNEFCNSSARTYRAMREAGLTHASATAIRSPGYESRILRHER